MLWKLLIAVSSILSRPFNHSPPTPLGPQSAYERQLAYKAFYGDHGEPMIEEAGLKDNDTRWHGYPGNPVVPYVLDRSLDQSMKDLIKDAIEQYHQNTCIKFKIRTNEPDYVNIFAGRGCYSNSIGKRKYGGRQDVSLGLGCGFIGTVVHELGHAIGLSHEHSRSDRDLHITVYKNNIAPNRIGQFNITDPKIEFKTTRYNCESIMHYGEYAFSIKPQVLKSMEAKDGKTKLLEPYDKAGLTNTDIQMVKDLYDCK